MELKSKVGMAMGCVGGPYQPGRNRRAIYRWGFGWDPFKTACQNEKDLRKLPQQEVAFALGATIQRVQQTQQHQNQMPLRQQQTQPLVLLMLLRQRQTHLTAPQVRLHQQLMLLLAKLTRQPVLLTPPHHTTILMIVT